MKVRLQAVVPWFATLFVALMTCSPAALAQPTPAQRVVVEPRPGEKDRDSVRAEPSAERDANEKAVAEATGHETKAERIQKAIGAEIRGGPTPPARVVVEKGQTSEHGLLGGLRLRTDAAPDLVARELAGQALELTPRAKWDPMTSAAQEQLRRTLAQSPGLVFVRSTALYRGVRKALQTMHAASSDGPTPLVVYNKTGQAPVAVAAALNRPIRTVKVLHAIPRTSDEGVAVHGSAASDYPTDYWQSTRATMSYSLPDAVDVRDGKRKEETDAAAFSRAVRDLAEKGTDLILAVGEVQGPRMVFPDRSSVVIEAVRQAAPNLLVLGCNSANHVEPTAGTLAVGTGRRIDYQQATLYASFLSSYAAKRWAGEREQGAPPLIHRDLLRLLQYSTWTGAAPAGIDAIVPVSVVPIRALRIGTAGRSGGENRHGPVDFS